LIAGFALKAQCMTSVDGFWDGVQWRRFCYNDIQALYHPRQIDQHTFPYIWGYLGSVELQGGGIEYPVLTGLFMWLTGLPTHSWNQFLVVSALALAPFGLLTAYLLGKMSGHRALYWAAAPAIVLYAFHNWDLLVVAAATAGFYLWWKKRPLAAAAAFGVGGALKLYPLLFLIPLFVDVWQQDRKSARRTWWTGIGTVVLINLPIAFWNPPSWWLTYRFHSLRSPNVDSLWGQTFPSLNPSVINAVSGVLTVGSIGAALWWATRRSRDDGSFPFVQASGAILCAFLLWSKVQSPQYTLWLLPFFVLLDVRPRWWVAYTVVDLAVYVSVFRFFGDFTSGADVGLSAAHFVMIYAVFARALLHGVLFVVFLRSRLATAPRPDEATFVSHPMASLQPSES
jgi:uncharacterized membrane protein